MKSLIIAGKDFKVRIKDRKAIMMMFLMPIILTAILGSALKGVMGDSNSVMKTTVGVYVNEEDPLTIQFIHSVLLDKQMKKTLTVKQAKSEHQLKNWINKEGVDVGIIIPNQWKEKLINDKNTPVVILPVNGKDLEATFIQQLTESFASTTKTIATSTKTVLKDLAVASVADGKNINTNTINKELVQNMEKDLESNLELVKDTPIGDKKITSMQYYAAAMAAMFLLFNAMVGGKSFHNEKSTETLSRILTTPTQKNSILLGKFYGTLLFAFLQFLVFMGATHYLLKVSWGENSLQTFMIAFVYSFAVSGLSMIVASFTKDEKMADTLGGIGVQIFSLLGGSMLPISVFPEMLRKISMITPNSWALTSFTEVMSGTTWGALLLPVLILMLIGFVSLILGSWRLRTIY